MSDKKEPSGREAADNKAATETSDTGGGPKKTYYVLYKVYTKCPSDAEYRAWRVVALKDIEEAYGDVQDIIKEALEDVGVWLGGGELSDVSLGASSGDENGSASDTE